MLPGAVPARLAVRFGPEEDEGLMGWILRLSEANRYPTPFWILNAVGVGAPDAAERADVVARLVAMTEARKALVEHVVPTRRGSRQPRTDVLGMGLPSVTMDCLRPKVCPRCLIARKVLSYSWDLRLWTCCPIHFCRLVSTCPACSKPLTWRRRGVDACVDPACQGRPSLSEVVEASQAEADLAALLAETVDVESRPALSAIPEVFRTLDWHDRLVAISRLGLKRGSQSRTREGNVGIGPDAEPARKAASLLLDWPRGFHRFLDALVPLSPSGPRTVSSYPEVRLLIASTGNRDFVMPEKARTVFLNEYLAYLDKIGAPVSVRTAAASSEQRWISRRAAAKALDVDQRTLLRMIDTGEFDGKISKAGGRNRVYLDRSDVVRLAARQVPRSAREILREHGSAMTLVEAGGMLGITPPKVRSLIEEGLLDVMRSGVRVHVPRLSVKGLLDRLRECVRPAEDTVDAGATYDAIQVVQHMRGLRLGPFLRAVLKGEIEPARISESARGLAAIEFLRSDAAAYLARNRAATGNMPFPEVLALLKCDKPGLRGLLRDGLVRQGRTKTDVDETTVHSFLRKYASARMLAYEAGTRPSGLVRRFDAAGIRPVSVSPGEPGGTTFWSRQAVAAILSAHFSDDDVAGEEGRAPDA